MNSSQLNIRYLFEKIFEKKKLLVAVIAFSVLFGNGINWIRKDNYKTTVILLPNLSQESPGGLLSNLGGISSFLDIGSLGSSDGIGLMTYPELIKSNSFVKDFLSHTYMVDKNTVKVSDFFLTNQNTIVIEDTTKFYFTEEEEAIAEGIKERFEVSINVESGLLEIESIFPDPYLSYQANIFAQNYITTFTTKYLTAKEQKKVTFLEERLQEAEQRYINAQINLGNYIDSNMNVISESSKYRQGLLSEELNIAASLYKTIAQQLETSKVKLKESTPEFEVIEFPYISNISTKPSYLAVSVVSILLGVLIFIAWVTLEDYLIQ